MKYYCLYNVVLELIEFFYEDPFIIFKKKERDTCNILFSLSNYRQGNKKKYQKLKRNHLEIALTKNIFKFIH